MKPISPIKCVFFDLGHVLINVNINKCLHRCAQKSKVSLTKWIEAKPTDGGVSRDFDLGKITPTQFYQHIRKKFDLRMTYDEFVETYCDVFSINSGVVDLVQKLYSKVRLSIISNTDILHFSYILNTYEMMSLFEKPTTSFEVGVMKPEPGIYEFALHRMGVEPKHSVFVDDKYENVEGAQAVGMHGIHYNSETDLQEEFVRLGIYS